MKKMDTSTRLLKTGPMSSWSESMALYNILTDKLRDDEQSGDVDKGLIHVGEMYWFRGC